MDRKVLMVYYDLLDKRWSFYNDVAYGISYKKAEAELYGIKRVPGLFDIGAIRINKSVWIAPENTKPAIQLLIKHVSMRYHNLNINYAEAIFKEDDIQILWDRYKEYFINRVKKFLEKMSKYITVDDYVKKIVGDVSSVIVAFDFDDRELKQVINKVTKLVKEANNNLVNSGVNVESVGINVK